MNWPAIAFDWNQIRAFLATAEEGSLSAAARVLGQTQPTLSRQVTGLEEALGVVLFERGPRVMRLTQAGHEVLAHVRAMGDAALKVSLAASGQSQHVEGKVSITATELFARYHLAPIISELQEIAPRLLVEVIVSNDVRDLTRREADISIRHARPEQADLIGRLVNETTAHLYASKAYLDRVGRPRSMDDMADLDLISFDEAENIVPFLQGLGMPVTRNNMRASTSSGSLLVELARAGVGATFLTHDAGDRYADLEKVLPSMEPVPVPVWLVTHRELRTSRRIRIVFDLLAERLSGDLVSPGN
ncbi:MAG: LysR family transcriptional regulator [Alphaproteobacteria bacterium]|uniref:LysR family transcriptional regulator n=1 Tax=Pyruvatibacter sp. HU-CL02332 TaxID=3127650 RepID=UPI0029698A9E|nr:LysR family transcriptional regulator [Alphaproteobacteria bacterium]